MSSEFWGGGIVGGITGPEILVAPFSLLSGRTWFLDNSNALASNANDGSKLRPKLTLAGAVSAAAGEDIIVVGATHDEVISTQVSITGKPGLSIIGCETGAQMPRLTNAMASGNAIFVNSALVSFWSLRFGASSAAGAENKVRVDTGTSGILFHGCRIDQGSNDAAIKGINVAEVISSPRFESCIFTSTGVSGGGVAPAAGLAVTDDVSGLEIIDSVFDGSIYGWGLYALDASPVCTHTRLRNVQFLRGSIGFFGTGTTYQMFRAFSDDGGNAIITA